MRVAIIGGTGFVGGYIVEALSAGGHQPRALVRPTSRHRLADLPADELVEGSLDDAPALRELLAPADAVIYNVGILREFPGRGITFENLQFRGATRVAEIALELGVTRFLLMSANGVDRAITAYQRTKLAAEDFVKACALDWTIFRPSVIFGDPRGRSEFASQLKTQIIDPPLPAPLFYSGILPRNPGGFCLSPVHVRDVASAIARSVDDPRTSHRTFTLGGPITLTWKQILETIAEACGKTKLMLPAPAFAPQIAASLCDRFPWFPVTRDQLTMLLEGNSCSGSALFDMLEIEPRAFEASQLGYLRC